MQRDVTVFDSSSKFSVYLMC